MRAAAMKFNKLAGSRKILDVWNIPVFVLFASFAVFLLYPIFMVIKSSMISADGTTVSFQSYIKFFSVSYYSKALYNTLLLGVLGTAGIIILVIPLAYFFTRYKIFGHTLVGTILWIPYLTPAFIGAYTWLILFGKYGLITDFFRNLGIMIPSIGGFGGILTVFILTYYPLGFILLIGAFQTVDPSLEEASHNLGASNFRRFWTVTVPSATPSILNASLLVFILIIDSFGIPAIVGVGTPVLTTLVFGEFTSEMGGPPVMAATGATILLFISMSILILQRVYLQKKSFVSSGTRNIEIINPRPVKKIILSLMFAVVLVFSLLPIITIIISSFTVANGPVLQYGQFTLDHYRNTFYAVLRPLKNSYILATSSMILDLTLGSLIGYVIIRKGKKMATFIDAFVALPLGVPGVLLGIGLILGFSRGPIVLVGTASILIVAYFVRRLPHPVRTVSAILAQVDENIEEASVNLGVPPVKTFLKVTTRMIFPGIATGGLLAWTTSVSDLTCTILIYPARWKTLTVETYAQIRSDLYGPASVVGIFLLLSVMVPIFIVNLISQRRDRKKSMVKNER
ncbi:MAG: hypothetical protein DRP60_01790 [Spirochaetes bacterium]|nr:MAG: hypothetical protein DRP60_01790 [Spirochaetota bacterium]